MKNYLRTSAPTHRQSGFSLVEMIGVLAIIAILAVIIVPKVFSTIASARITSASSSVNAIKSAVSDYAGKYGTIPLTTTNANARLDDLLIQEGLLDGRFIVKIGTAAVASNIATYTRATDTWAGGANQTTQSRIICQASVPGTAPSVANGANFRIAGNNLNLPASVRVVSAAILGVTASEARELSLRIDGEIASAALGAADNAGRVVYAAPTAGTTNVYVYIAHQ
ncbi:MAG: prepilin-type N-terminal cleavage/methylation domain-containing protein [Nibricoccus sp.]